DVARRYGGGEQGIDRLIALTRWSLTNEDRTVIADTSGDRAPRWSETLVSADTLTELRERFDRNTRLAFRVPLLVKRKKAKAASTFFDVFLEKDDSLRKPESHFIRRGNTIPDVRSTVTSEKAARAFIVNDHEALCTFLGNAD